MVPAPVRVIELPFDPVIAAMFVVTLLSVPLDCTVNVPVPCRPTKSCPFVHVEPLPLTLAVPLEPVA